MFSILFILGFASYEKPARVSSVQLKEYSIFSERFTTTLLLEGNNMGFY
jgi:hypothetical protein